MLPGYHAYKMGCNNSNNSNECMHAPMSSWRSTDQVDWACECPLRFLKTKKRSSKFSIFSSGNLNACIQNMKLANCYDNMNLCKVEKWIFQYRYWSGQTQSK